jgi:ABC-type transport system involved in multi-copper enzyme maturation permease subunit
VIERLENPVFRQTSRQRMRGVRTYGCLIAYLLVLALVVVISYDQFLGVGVRRGTAGLAQTLFETLVATQWFLVAFITPALTTSAITMEREQRTYDLLVMTLMSRMAIVWGKFASAVAFVAVMILCGMPLVAVLFLMGGVDTGLVLERYAGMLITGALLAAFGLMMSAICSNTTVANVLTYGILASVYFAGVVFGIAFVISRAFGGASVSTFWPGLGLNSWQFWLLIAVSVLLTLAILLQVAANYLLPDARQGAWKTRLLTALLHLLSLFAAMLTAKRAAFPVPVPNYTAIVTAASLATVALFASTGVPLGGKRWWQWLHPRSLRVGTVQSALLYLLLLLLAGAAADQFLPAKMRSGLVVWLYLAGYVWWLWALGYFASVVVRNRWGALFLLVGMLYLFAQMVYNVTVFSDRPDDWLFLLNFSAPVELFRDAHSCALWSIAYVALGLTAAALGSLIHRKREHA